MCRALDPLNAKSIIITSKLDFTYNKDKINVISGDIKSNNSLSAVDTYKYYSISRFICIPCAPKVGRNKFGLNGLTSFVDAVVMHKPVLISDNTNMGIDVEGLGIGVTYKAGNVDDMSKKMKMMLSMSDEDYDKMCLNMKEYSKSHNYDVFCKELISIISEEG